MSHQLARVLSVVVGSREGGCEGRSYALHPTFFLRSFAVDNMASDIQAVIEGPASDGSSSSSGEQSGVGRRGTRRGPGAGHGGPEAAGGSEGTPPENKLFRVEDFMQTFVKQEATMWQKGCLFSSSSLAGDSLLLCTLLFTF